MASCVRARPGPVVVTAVLAIVLLVQAAATPVLAYAVGSGAGSLTAAASVAVMLRSNPFEARLAAVAVSSASGLMAVLTMVFGAPGEAPAGPTLCSGLLLACALALPPLLASRSRGARVTTDPYPQGS